jgi:hypothetical protein
MSAAGALLGSWFADPGGSEAFPAAQVAGNDLIRIDQSDGL